MAAGGLEVRPQWMACYSTEEIAVACDVSKASVNEICSETADLPEANKSAANHASDFSLPIYNIWKQQEKTTGSSHFGNSEVRWVDNLLYLYTKPFDVVVDPFGKVSKSWKLSERSHPAHARDLLAPLTAEAVSVPYAQVDLD